MCLLSCQNTKHCLGCPRRLFQIRLSLLCLFKVPRNQKNIKSRMLDHALVIFSCFAKILNWSVRKIFFSSKSVHSSHQCRIEWFYCTFTLFFLCFSFYSPVFVRISLDFFFFLVQQNEALQIKLSWIESELQCKTPLLNILLPVECGCLQRSASPLRTNVSVQNTDVHCQSCIVMKWYWGSFNLVKSWQLLDAAGSPEVRFLHLGCRWAVLSPHILE